MKKNRVALADPFDANDESETKTRIPVWLYPSTLEAMDRVAESINCKSRSDFLERAAQFYVGYITEQDACAYLPPALATAIRGTVQDKAGGRFRPPAAHNAPQCGSFVHFARWSVFKAVCCARWSE